MPEDGYGLSCAASVLGPNRNILIQGIQANNNMRKGIDVHSGHNITISGNFITGFGRTGIYAVNEGLSKNVKNIKIINNQIDGIGNDIYRTGIEVGSYGSNAIESGSFIIANNTICNTHTASSTAILIMNPSAGGIPPEKVIISDNTIHKGSASNSDIILCNNAGIRINEVVISNNLIDSNSSRIAIYVREAIKSIIYGNQIDIIEPGTANFGIFTSPEDHSLIFGNNLSGIYSTPIKINSNSLLIGNMVNGQPYP